MATFERELVSSRACLGSGNGKYVRLHRVQAGRRFVPQEMPVGPKMVDMDDVGSILGRVKDARGILPYPITAIEVFQLCQNAEHNFHRRTERFSALLERVGAIVIADAVPIPVKKNNLIDPKYPRLDILLTAPNLSSVRSHSPVQRLAVALDENSPPITHIVEAAISEPHHEAYVALQGLTGVRIASSEELR